MSPSSTKSRGGTVASVILTVVLLLASGWLWLNQQYVIDQVAVWRYEPTSQVSGLADRSGMSDQGRFLYYASHPEIEGTQKFNEVCSRKKEGTAILGCYTGTKIFIFGITDERLDGIQDVTAAHEMLHAAYQRLSATEREQVDRLLDIEHAKLGEDADFKKRMAFYAETQPGEAHNELHSIIGTEVASINSELEEYYKKFFNDRSKVVALHTNYSGAFEELKAQAAEIETQFNSLGEKIKNDSQQYNNNVSALDADIQAFNVRARSGDFASQAQFDRERAALNARVTALTNLRTSIQADVTQYEALRTEYNQIASQSKQLNDSLDSTLAPAPSI